MKSICISVLVTAVTFGYTQIPDTLWTKTYGGALDDVGYSIQQTSDGGYIIAGSTESFGAGGQDVWLLKTDASGDTAWTRSYGGANDDWAAGVQQAADGGYVIAAITESFAPQRDIWIIRTDSVGNNIVDKKYGGAYPAHCHSIQRTSDGNYIIAGGRAPGGMWLLKIDENCDTVWTMYCEMNPSYDGTYASFACETFDGGYVVVGGVIGMFGTVYGFHMKTDSMGDTLWTNSHNWDVTHFECVRQTSDGSYIICGGITNPPGQEPDFYIAKADAEGETLWTKVEEGEPSTFIQLTNDGGYIITGVGGSQAYLFKTNASGDSLWKVFYGGSYGDCVYAVQQTNDGGYIVVGYTETYGSDDVWIIKTEPDLGIEAGETGIINVQNLTATIFHGPLQLPEGMKCKVYDIAGRIVEPDKITRGIYFVEVDGIVTQKVVKVR